jgi:zinc/manganese transport system substrate-binding protein
MTQPNRATPRRFARIAPALAAVALFVAACGSSSASAGAPATNDGRKQIVVTYSVLGAVVKDLVGDAADVTVLMPNGADPHQWAPSARDIETLVHADMIVENGLGLEGGLVNALEQAASAGVPRFVATDWIKVRHVGAGEGVGSSSDQAVGAADPHFWMDPLTMSDVVVELGRHIKTDLGIDLTARRTDLESRLNDLTTEMRKTLDAVPAGGRKLVTGHESMGYFADRFDFTLIGAIVPGLSDQAETSSSDLAALEAKIKSVGVKAIFTELGTSAATAQAVAQDTGAKVVELSTHVLPADGSYFTFMRDIASTIATNLA